jgi:hypothetical protein
MHIHVVMPRIGTIILSISHTHDKQKHVDDRDLFN